MKYDIRSVSARFDLRGEYLHGSPYGSGHINDTYAVTINQAGTPVRYIVQRLNHTVFRAPVALMENIIRVTSHVRHGLEAAGASDISRRVLTLVPARDGRFWHVDAEGNFWRCYLFIEQARTYDLIEEAQQARAAARAFGHFQQMLADLPAPRLHDSIPEFHHTPARLNAMRQAVAADRCRRVVRASQEIEFVLARQAIASVLADEQTRGHLPERVTHNDTKLNNVMLDDATGEGICVIDLDTVMPGLVLYDFGDMCRTACRPAAEDERDLSKVEMRMDMFRALVTGYLDSAGGFLTAAERSYLAFSARLITFEIGIRFLTDHLDGDRYFKIYRAGQNLDRARVQFKLVDSFERNEGAMNEWVQAVANEIGCGHGDGRSGGHRAWGNR